MKKLILLAMVITALLCQSALAATYPTTFVVVEVDEVSDSVLMQDFNGQLWGWYGIEDTMVGDVIAAIMDDCGTAEVFDDEIVSIRYCGWLDGWQEIAG